MLSDFRRFEKIARQAERVSETAFAPVAGEHPFDARNIYPSLPGDVRVLFDNGHYSQATFEAYKFLDNEVKRHSSSAESGTKLMMQVFGGTNPVLQLTALVTETQRGEQQGYKFLFAGGALAIRNPRGHEHSVRDDPDTCLDHLSLASMLLRRLAAAGFK